MLEDMSSAGWQLWRDGMTALAKSPKVNVKLSGLGTFAHACGGDIMGPIVRETVTIFGADRCFYGSNFFPIEKLWLTARRYTGHSGMPSLTSMKASSHDPSRCGARLYRL
jgi:predicted TIM-barrel fold metal-dependent hydrolase